MISPLTRRLALFGVLSVALFNGVLVVAFGQPLERTSWRHFQDLVALDLAGADSWRPMVIAFDHAESAPPDQRTPLYEAVFFGKNVKFQYAPTSLLAVHGLRASGVDRSSWYEVLNGISAILVALMALVTWGILEHGLRRERSGFGSAASRADWLARGLLVAILTATFYPVAKAFTLGQIQAWINGLFAVLLWCWLKDRRIAAGVLAGAICLLKPQFLVLLAWGLLRRQWQFASAFAGVLMVGAMASVWLVGAGDHIDYLGVLAHLSRHGESFYPNQSVNGLLNRWFDPGSGLDFDSTAFPPFDPVIYAGTIVTSMLLIGAALFWPARNGERGSAADLAVAALAATMASPIAWEHHYGILLPIYAYLLPRALAGHVFGRFAPAALGGSYLLTSNFIFVVNQWVASPPLQSLPAATLLQSYLFAGALMTLTCLYVLRQSPQPSADRVVAASEERAVRVSA